LARELRDQQAVANLLNSLAVFYFSLKQFEQALFYYQQALPIYQNIGDPAKLGLLQNSLCATLLRLKRFDEVILESRAAAHLNQEQKTLEGHRLAMLADAHLGLRQHQEALDAYLASLALRRENSDEKGIGWMLYSMSQVYLQMNQLIQSTTYLSEAKEIAVRLAEQALLDVCEQAERALSR
jgi:tetratricopeptide (TPR) repeat protein